MLSRQADKKQMRKIQRRIFIKKKQKYNKWLRERGSDKKSLNDKKISEKWFNERSLVEKWFNERSLVEKWVDGRSPGERSLNDINTFDQLSNTSTSCALFVLCD